MYHSEYSCRTYSYNQFPLRWRNIGTHSHGGQVYVCSHYPSCNSYVGVHPGTKIPKGTLANRELRQKRIQAHRIFDQIWQQGILSKPEAYRWVADKFCLTDKQAHIGQFSNYMCDQLIRESADVLKNNHIPFRLRAASWKAVIDDDLTTK